MYSLIIRENGSVVHFSMGSWNRTREIVCDKKGIGLTDLVKQKVDNEGIYRTDGIEIHYMGENTVCESCKLCQEEGVRAFSIWILPIEASQPAEYMGEYFGRNFEEAREKFIELNPEMKVKMDRISDTKPSWMKSIC